MAEPDPFRTSSSHSVFYTAASDIGPLLIKVCVDTLLAGGNVALAAEFEALRIASLAGLAPKPYFVDGTARVLVQEFVAGTIGDDWTTHGLRACIRLATRLMALDVAATSLRTAHLSYSRDIEEAGRILDGLAWLDDHARSLARTAAPYAVRLRQLGDVVQPLIDGLPLVVSHNDVSPENTITDVDRALLIDFETASLTRTDFLGAQLAVDALIEDHLAGTRVRHPFEICDVVREMIQHDVSASVLRARILERLFFNLCYALRQVVVPGRWSRDENYVARKRTVAQACALMLDEFSVEWRLPEEVCG